MSEPSSNAANQDQRLVDHGEDGADSFQNIYMEDVPQHINQYGLEGIEEFFTKKLEEWKDVEINIAVTGDAGAGKSSFINAIRGLKNDHKDAAETSPMETTKAPEEYLHPSNKNIKFWDLPGIGTPNYPAESYGEKVNLKKYDTFLIIAATRFTENDFKLARLIAESIKKSFFFVRTKMDIDVMNEKADRPAETFNEDALVEKIKNDCLKNLKKFESENKSVPVFLISNRQTAKWDFVRLTQAILDGLPMRQKECLTLSLNVMTSRSKEMMKRKVEILRGRIWMVAGASGAGAVIPVPGVSIALDLTFLKIWLEFYKRQLGLPNENSNDFIILSPLVQEMVKQFSSITKEKILKLATAYGASSTVEEITRQIPVIGPIFAAGLSFTSTFSFLQICLNDMETTALAFLEDLNTKLANDLPID